MDIDTFFIANATKLMRARIDRTYEVQYPDKLNQAALMLKSYRDLHTTEVPWFDTLLNDYISQFIDSDIERNKNEQNYCTL